MWLLSLAWKNIWRNRSRTLITMAAIFFAVLLSVLENSFTTGVFDNLVKNVVGFYTGYIQVHQKGYWDEQILDNSFKEQQAMAKKISAHPAVTALTPRLESFALASSDAFTKGCLVAGIDPEAENGVTQLKTKLSAGQYLEKNDHSVLLGEGLAKRLQLGVNDTLVLIGQGYHGAMAAGKYPVKGLVKFGAPDLNDKALFMPLAAAQELYSAEGMITSWVLSLKDGAKTKTTAGDLQALSGEAYEVMSWEQMLPDIKQHIDADTNSMKYIQGILYLLVCFGIFGTLLMMMVERRFEMGMLVAIGMKKPKLMVLVVFESVITVLAGCLLGILVAIPVVHYLNVHPLRLGAESTKVYERFGFEAVFPTATDASIFISQGLFVLAASLLLSLYPVYKVWRLDAVTAMKR